MAPNASYPVCHPARPRLIDSGARCLGNPRTIRWMQNLRTQFIVCPSAAPRPTSPKTKIDISRPDPFSEPYESERVKISLHHPKFSMPPFMWEARRIVWLICNVCILHIQEGTLVSRRSLGVPYRIQFILEIMELVLSINNEKTAII